VRIWPGKKTEVVERIIKLSEIDEEVCRNIYKGEIDEDGYCVMRIRESSDKPDVAELVRIRLVKTGKPKTA